MTNNPIISNGTVDITDVVEAMRSAFVTWGTAYIFGLEIAIPGMGWLALPIIGDLDRALVRALLNLLSKSVVLEAFFLNTAIRKNSQANDFINAVNLKNNLPATATEAEYAYAESLQIAAFRDFVLLSN